MSPFYSQITLCSDYFIKSAGYLKEAPNATALAGKLLYGLCREML